jgi:hypothetical protein
MVAPSMPYQVTRTDTGQFVLIDPGSETVVIDDDLASGFAKLDKILAERPRTAAAATAVPASAFEFRGGPRYTPMLLAIVLPFVWLAALYLLLAHLLSQHSLTLEQAKDTQAQITDLQAELQALRSEISGAPRSAKTKPPKNKAKPLEPPPDDVATDEPSEPPDEVGKVEPTREAVKVEPKPEAKTEAKPDATGKAN